METKTMKFNETTSFLGRNGCFKQKGIEVTDMGYNDIILFEPTTSKGITGRSYLTVPKDQLSEFINLLREFENPA